MVGTRKDAVSLKLQALLASFGITRYYIDKARGYQRHLPSEQHTVGKLTMQKIERKHLTLRTRLKRLARKTLCFSRSCEMHDLLIGLYMNRVEFGCPVQKGLATKMEHYRHCSQSASSNRLRVMVPKRRISWWPLPLASERSKQAVMPLL
jgi:IS1 family transposase